MSEAQLKPGFKKTDVGVIPEDWGVRRLGELFEVTSSKRVFQSEWTSSGIPFYRARELAVLGEAGSVDNELFITRAMYEDFKTQHGVPQIGDMLVTGVGTLGKTYVVNDYREFYFKDGNIIWFKVNDAICPEFLRQLYLTAVVIKQIKDGSSGTTVGTYTISAAKKTIIPFPSRQEQNSISEALSAVDNLLSKLDQLIAKKRDLKKATMQQLLNGKTRLPGFSEGWDIKTIEELEQAKLLRLSRGKVISKKDIDRAPGDFPIYSSSVKDDGIFGTYGEYMFDEELITWSVDGGGHFFHRPRHKFSVTNVSGFMRVDTTKLHYRYLAAQLQHLHSRMIFDYTLKAHPSVIRKAYTVPLPPFEEQVAIATAVTDMEAEIVALEERREKTRSLKLGMMQELLTGRLRLI